MEQLEQPKKRGIKSRLWRGAKAAGKVAVAAGTGLSLPEIMDAVHGAAEPAAVGVAGDAAAGADPLEAALTRLAGALIALALLFWRRPQDG